MATTMSDPASSTTCCPPPPPLRSSSSSRGGGGDDDDDRNKNSSSTRRHHLLLIEFAYKHVNFQWAELQSVLECQGIAVIQNKNNSSSKTSSSSSLQQQQPEPDQYECRIISLPTASSSSTTYDGHRPFVILDLCGANMNDVDQLGATLIAQCTLVRSVMELWGMGASLEACVASTREFATSSHGRTIIEPHQQHKDKSWKFTVHALGSSLSMDEQERIRSQFAFLDFEGPVQMKDPDTEFVYLQEIRLDSTGKATSADSSHNHNNTTLACYMGRALGGTRQTKGRARLEHYTLKKRAYLGPTSMDAELALIMASLAKVQLGSIVYDPFVGTGSILVACALKGASHVMGSDIDIRVLRGKGPHANVFSNFAQFGLSRPELLRTDNAIYHRHYRHHRGLPLYDAIVTDPPYGIRAGARQCGSKRNQPRTVPEEHRSTHIPQTRPYPVSDVMADLLDVASRTLVMGGRLVYIIPSISDFDPDVDVPHHDCLRLVHSCFQPLQSELGRRVIVMEKITDYDDSRRDHYLSNIWKNGSESAEKVANIRDKLLEAAQKKPRYEEKLALRQQKRRLNRQAKRQAKKQSPPSSSQKESTTSTNNN